MQIASIVDIQKIYIETDVVDCKVPLLLSKVAMKKAEINIDFAVDCHNFWITLGNHFGDLHEMDPVRKITWFWIFQQAGSDSFWYWLSLTKSILDQGKWM